jgi:hypothetical protein
MQASSTHETEQVFEPAVQSCRLCACHEHKPLHAKPSSACLLWVARGQYVRERDGDHEFDSHPHCIKAAGSAPGNARCCCPRAHLMVSCEQAPLAFHCRDGVHGVGTAQLIGGTVGQAHVSSFALVDQRLSAAHQLVTESEAVLTHNRTHSRMGACAIREDRHIMSHRNMQPAPLRHHAA